MRRSLRCMLVLVVVELALVLGPHAVAAASSIGFASSFTSAVQPFTVIECDAACTSPSVVTFSLVLERSGDLSGTDAVHVSTRSTDNGTVTPATPGEDYYTLSDIAVVFRPEEASKQVNVTVLSDGIYEEDEGFEAVLSKASPGVSLTDSANTAYITIQDGGDAGIFSFYANSYTFAEDAGRVQVKIVRQGGASGSVTVTYRLTRPTEATAINNKNFRFVDTTFSVQFDENQQVGYIDIDILNDNVYESDEFFFLEISTLAPTKASDPTTSIAKLGTPLDVVVIIADDGDAGQFDFSAPFIFCREDTGRAVVTIRRSLGTSSSSYTPVSLVVATVGTSGGSNATEGENLAFDYYATSEKLNWVEGESEKEFSVKVNNNNKYDMLPRAFKIAMSRVEGGAAIGPQSTMWVYIVDDRDAGTFSFKVSHYEVLESASTVSVEIVRTGIPDSSKVNTYSSGSVNVTVATYAGTIIPGLTRYEIGYDYGVVAARKCTHVSPCTAVPGFAYTALPPTTLTFADGEVSKVVDIPIVNNDLYEAPDRVFKVILSDVSGGAHIGIDYEHPSEWSAHPSEYLALETKSDQLLDNVGTIVTILDDGDPAILISKVSLSLSEIGQYDSFRCWLNSKPTSEVSVALSVNTDLITLSNTILTFSLETWNIAQTIHVTAVPNHRAQGLHQSYITFSASSTDATYSNPVRLSGAAAGVVFAAGIYIQKEGTYDTGSEHHAFPWSESAGVMTGPRDTARVSAFILDDDHANVVLAAERIRHRSLPSLHVDHLSCRLNGHNANVAVSLSSAPAGDVTVHLVASDGLGVTPTVSRFTSASWSIPVNVEVVATESSAPELNSLDPVVTTVAVFVTSVTDILYDQPSTPAATIHVQRYQAAGILLDASILETRENDKEREQDVYTLQLGSAPMHWDAGEGAYVPFGIGLQSVADTTLTFSTDAEVIENPVGGLAATIAAGNASTSTIEMKLSRLAVLRFNVFPIVVESTGSHQVGAAILRLYRLEGGENGGLGGVIVGVATASVDMPDDWDEATMYANCTITSPSEIPSSTTCDVMDSSSSSIPFFPDDVTADRIASINVGETQIIPTGEFDASINAFIPSPGWIEVDVTTALNKFLARQHQRDLNGLSTSTDLTLMIYTRSSASFTYDGVDEVVFAAKDHVDSSKHPEIRVLASGRVNLASFASVSQSQPGNADAAIDGNPTSELGISSTFAMSSTASEYPWWQADFSSIRLVDEVIVTVKRKISTAFTTELQRSLTIWCFLSNISLTTDNNGVDGFTTANATARFKKRFDIASRSFSATESDNIVFRWRVSGDQDGFYADDHFTSNYSTKVEARYLLIQVEGENSIALNEVEVFQPALAMTRVEVGGFMPSPAFSRKGQNQIEFDLGQPGATSDCDAESNICRHELIFTSGDWWIPQSVVVKVIDDPVATGTRNILLTHYAKSFDPNFRGSSVCNTTQASPEGPCNPVLFNDSSVKILRVTDDDENSVIFSTSKLEIEEGSGVFPNAPAFQRIAQIMPSSVMCSSEDEPTISALAGSASTAPCSNVFMSSTQNWDVCISNSSAFALEAGSAWVISSFPSDQFVTEIVMTIPSMTSAKYIRQLTVWWNYELDLDSTPASILLDTASGWIMVDTFPVAMTSKGEQVIKASNLTLYPAKLLLFTFDESYDDIENCLVAPHIKLMGYESIPFPLPVRGDITNANAVPPAQSFRSRMHQYGSSAKLEVRLSSEPIQDVFVSAVSEPQNRAVTIFDSANNSMASSLLVDMTGGAYESGELISFRLPTGLRFTPKNWNETQVLTFLSIDDNTYNGNRTFTIRHAASSDDSTAALVPQQFLTTDGVLTRTFGILPTPLMYKNAPFVIRSTHSEAWPYNWNYAWTSVTGSIAVKVVDDDLPGITLSHNEVIVSESANNGSYSVLLDSAPAQEVVITITYERDPLLLKVDPMQLTFTSVNWNIPQIVYIQPTPNDKNDAESPFALSYAGLIPKAKQPILRHTVFSTDESYNGIAIGGNEPDQGIGYVVNQGVVAIVQDDDTGCSGEYKCLNGGTCIVGPHSSEATTHVCQCPAHYGMKDCGAVCLKADDCAFNRVELRLKCPRRDRTGVCSESFAVAKLVSTLYRMLTQSALVLPNGKEYAKLELAPVYDVMYVVNISSSSCADSSNDPCMVVLMDLVKSPTTKESNIIVDKLNGYLEAGSLQVAPLYVTVMTDSPQYEKSIGTTATIWSYVGFCAASVVVAMGVFLARHVKTRRLNARQEHSDVVAPFADEGNPDHAIPPHH